MLRVLTPLILIMLFISYTTLFSGKIENIDGYPIWLKDSAGNRTDQTSGLYYLGKDGGRKVFITCDDIGAFHKLYMDESVNPPALQIQDIYISSAVNEYLKNYKKRDFEEIAADKNKNILYLSIEGFNFDREVPLGYKQFEGIFELNINKDLLTFDSITTITKLSLPEEVFQYTQDNIGFEGLGITEAHLFLGLENCQKNPNEFTDSTYIYVYDRITGEIKTVSTKPLGIGTVCGLYAVNDYEIYGIDRNARKMFYIKFNPDYTVASSDLTEMDLPIPGHPDINDIIGTSPESITMDENGALYSIVDPWKDMYKPDLPEKKMLTNDELENFSKFIPIMYKYKNSFK